MPDRILTDELWARLEPLLPALPPRRFRYPGRRRTDNRAALEGILLVVRTGIAFNDLPTAAFGASGATCWRRLTVARRRCLATAARAAAGRTTRRGPHRLGPCRGGLLPSTGAERGDHTGPSPVDRGRRGSKHHLITDAAGTPLAVTLTGGHRNDVTQLLPLVEAIPPIRGLVGRPLRRPRRIYADRGYDHDKYRRLLRQRGITPVIARRGTAHGSGLGTKRWVVERTFAWLHAFKRLRTRSERRADVHQAMLSLACAVICLRKLLASF
ncbi:IS5 family transposase [Couchioplanes caeruleus]|uniref:Transposase n=1 Tax=Couchioplanes caeruleus TaxID=56438 RepID=A0A3N1GHW8_9ACTN|nr:IS5 family transposase [Couchioplanes caeruleus]ROP29805.1 transposase [Couchioplanes caeruleus]